MFGQIIDHIGEVRAKWTVGTHPRDPALVKLFGLQEGDIAASVDRVSSLGYPPIWRGVNLISGDVGKLPVHILKRTAGNAKERAPKHSAFRLIRRRPNSEMSANVFKQTLTAHALLEGNGYAFIFRKGNGEPDELWPLLPDRTNPIRVDGVLWYVTRINGEERKLAAEDVIHIKGLSFNGIAGYSVVDLCRNAIALSLGLESYAETYFENGATPSGILHHPSTLDDDAMDRIRNSWNKLHTGLKNRHKLALFEEGSTYTPLTHEPEKSQLVESREFDLLIVADILSLPPHKLGHPSRTSHASLEEENQSYLDDTLDIWLVRWEEELTEKLLTEQQKQSDQFFVEFLREAALRTKKETASKILIDEVNNGLRTPDQALAINNLPPMPNGEGQKFRIPVNIKIQGEDPEPATMAPPPAEAPDVDDEPTDEDDDRQARALAAARAAFIVDATRACKRIGLHARRAAKSPGKFLDWLDGFADEHKLAVTQILSPSLGVCRAVAGGDDRDNRTIRDQFERIRNQLLRQMFQRVHHELLDAADATPDKFAAAVDLRMGVIETDEPTRLADMLIETRTTYHPAGGQLNAD